MANILNIRVEGRQKEFLRWKAKDEHLTVSSLLRRHIYHMMEAEPDWERYVTNGKSPSVHTT